MLYDIILILYYISLYYLDLGSLTSTKSAAEEIISERDVLGTQLIRRRPDTRRRPACTACTARRTAARPGTTGVYDVS